MKNLYIPFTKKEKTTEIRAQIIQTPTPYKGSAELHIIESPMP